MMQVRVVRVSVGDRGMPVRVRVRLGAVPRKVVVVPVMLVVHVPVRMLQRFVRVRVLVPLGQVQPHAGAHQRRGSQNAGDVGPQRRRSRPRRR